MTARRHRYQPALERTPYPLAELVEGIRAEFFPDLPGPVPVFFATHEPLACAVTWDRELAYPAVYYHQVLNHPDTPIEVMRFIAKHELLHFVVPPKLNGRVRDDHPPEFWEAEERIAPEGPLAWGWLWANLHTCLKRRSRLRRVQVQPGWKKLEFGPRLPWQPSELQLYLQTTGDQSPRLWTRRKNVPLRRGPAQPRAGQAPIPAR